MPNDENSPHLTDVRPQPMAFGRRKRQAATPEVELLQALLTRLNITNWDVFLVGDGSGSGWANGCGWAYALIDRLSRGRRLDYGAMNAGSINLAESMPYLQALTWYDNHGGKELLKVRGVLQVHVLTDSQVIANWGTAAMQGAETPVPRKQLAIWAAMREYRRLGYHCTFHWANRSTSLLNWAADLIAGLCRREMEKLVKEPGQIERIAVRAARAIDNVQFQSPTGEAISIYHLNPDV